MGYVDNSGLSYFWSKIKSKLSGKAGTNEAIKNITRSGGTFTATRADNTTFTFDQLKSLKNSVLMINTSASTKTINISSLSYNSSTDILQICINGLKLISSEYSISGSTLTLVNTIPAGNIIEITVTKIG